MIACWCGEHKVRDPARTSFFVFCTAIGDTLKPTEFDNNQKAGACSLAIKLLLCWQNVTAHLPSCCRPEPESLSSFDSE